MERSSVGIFGLLFEKRSASFEGLTGECLEGQLDRKFGSEALVKVFFSRTVFQVNNINLVGLFQKGVLFQEHTQLQVHIKSGL